jgi:hypothetical protein
MIEAAAKVALRAAFADLIAELAAPLPSTVR